MDELISGLSKDIEIYFVFIILVIGLVVLDILHRKL
jgi:hypothetical protein